MEYLKKFNESSNNNLEFDEFKYIMTTIEDIDSLTDFNIQDVSDDIRFNSYECWFELKCDIPEFRIDETLYEHFGRTGVRQPIIPGEHSDNEAPYDLEKAIEAVNNAQNEMKSFIENDVQTILKRNEDIKLVLEKFKTIKKRLEEYDNCKIVPINYDGYNSIIFYIAFVLID
jgi:hypothetical protein